MIIRLPLSKCILSCILSCFLLLSFPPSVYAEGEEVDSFLDPDGLQTMLNRYFEEKDILSDLVSVGYVYTETGETWYHNPDCWYYSASLYKVPLMMLLAERVAAGELTNESEICGLPLSLVEEEVLTFSNNDIAYSVLLSMDRPDAVRRMYQRYSSIPEEDYPPEFAGYSYFSARFMTDVLQTLYSDPERFPNITDCLLDAQPGHYFRLILGDEIPIAQKYGRDSDLDGNDWNHTAGIFYTRHPFILTVMTRYGGISETIIGDLAVMFYDYSLQLDSHFDEWKAMQTQDVLLQDTEKETPAEDPLPVSEANSHAYPASSAAPVIEGEAVEASSQFPSMHEAKSRSTLIFLLSAAAVLMLTVYLFQSLRIRKARSGKRYRRR